MGPTLPASSAAEAQLGKAGRRRGALPGCVWPFSERPNGFAMAGGTEAQMVLAVRVFFAPVFTRRLSFDGPPRTLAPGRPFPESAFLSSTWTGMFDLRLPFSL